MLAQIFGATVNSSTFQTFRNAPYTTLVSEARLTVGLVASALLVALPNTNYQLFIRNSGTSNLRIGVAPEFVTPAGFLLKADEVLVMELDDISLSVISDAAGGLMDRLILRT
jgi:hypothetical protein